MNEYYSTRIYLVRHAQAVSEDGSYGPNTQLSDLGRKQAYLVAEAFTNIKDINAIYTSPYPRAKETAELIGRKIKLTVSEDIRLSEFQLGTSPKSQLGSKFYLSIWKPEHTGLEGGETVEQFFNRVGIFCKEICNNHKNESIILVAHAGTIVGIYRWAMGIPTNSPWTFNIEVGNASISEFEMWPNGRVDKGPPNNAFLKRMGDCSHLATYHSNI